jgi:hypothetical protein
MTDNDISPEEGAALAEIAKATGRTLEQVKRVERLRKLGFRELPSTGRGYILPVGKRPPAETD